MQQKDKKKGFVKAQAAKLVDLAGYQEDSIVSRIIIDRSTGTVTFFAFDEGQGLSEHAAPYDALVHILDGEADVTISKRTVRMKEGEIILIPSKRPHSLKAAKKFKMLLTMIRS